MPRLSDTIRAGARSIVFVHCPTSVDYLAELSKALPGVHHSPERALLLARSNDVVCVGSEVDTVYLDYLAELGLGPYPANIIVASDYGDVSPSAPLCKTLLESPEALARLTRRMQKCQADSIHPFISSAGHFHLALALGKRLGLRVEVLSSDPELVARLDHKRHIRAAAIQLGIPVAPGEVLHLPQGSSPSHRLRVVREAVLRQSIHTGRIIVRGASGASGSSTFLVSPRESEIEQLAATLEQRRDNPWYLIEAMVDADSSPNIQMYVGPSAEAIECVAVSDQRLTRNLVHQGNAYPSQARCLNDMIRWSQQMAQWLLEAGYIGIAGFDFVEYHDANGTPKAFLAELNPRVNGASYPLALRERLGGIPAMASGTIYTGVRDFAELRHELDQLLFSVARQGGVIPYNTGCLQYGQCGMIALGASRQEADELYAEAELILGATCARF